MKSRFITILSTNVVMTPMITMQQAHSFYRRPDDPILIFCDKNNSGLRWPRNVVGIQILQNHKDLIIIAAYQDRQKGGQNDLYHRTSMHHIWSNTWLWKFLPTARPKPSSSQHILHLSTVCSVGFHTKYILHSST